MLLLVLMRVMLVTFHGVRRCLKQPPRFCIDSGSRFLRENRTSTFYTEVYITVKTTVSSHSTRLRLLALTWMQTLESQQVQYCQSSYIHLMSVCTITRLELHRARTDCRSCMMKIAADWHTSQSHELILLDLSHDFA